MSDSPTQALVYAYGAGDPTGSAEVLAEAERQRDFWNRLVQADREHEAKMAEAARAGSPEYAKLCDHIDVLSARIDELITERRQARAKARARVPTPAIDAELDTLFPGRREARRKSFDALKVWRRENREFVREMEKARREKNAELRRESGLFWANYNRVLDAFEATRKRVRKRGGRPRFQDFDPRKGVLTVQIQRTASGLGAAPSEILAGKTRAIRVAPVDPIAHDPNARRGDRRRAARTQFVMRVDAAGHEIELPVTLHRPLPDDCRVKSVQLAWRHVGDRIKAQLCFTCKIPVNPAPHRSTKAVALDPGWRLESDGSLRVATLSDTDGKAWHLHLPARWMTGMDQVERLSQHIDKGLLEVANAISSEPDLPPAVAKAVEDWRPGRGARRVDADALDRAVFDNRHRSLPGALTHWRSRYRHLRQWRDNLREKLVRQRRERYRVFANRLAGEYGLIAYEQMDLAATARTKKRPDASDPELHAASRAQRVRACLFELAQILEHQAGKAGAIFEVIDGRNTHTCFECGHEHDQIPHESPEVTCEQCGETYDRDQNAARNILARATQMESAA